jgi:NodT family efflux transporter outer membrane factor (OMF) lipoprotein
LTAQDQTLSTVEGRFRLGLASRLEVAQTKTQRSLVAAEVPTLEQKITENLNQLALLLNRQPAKLSQQLLTATVEADPPPILSAGLPSDLLRQRPDIRRAERQLAAATAEVGVATADLFPRFSLSALIGLQSNSLSDLISSGSRYWSIGPSLNLPIFNRASLQAAVTISETERDEMLLSYEQTVLAAFVETETLLDQYRREQEARNDLRQAVQAGRQAVSFNEGLYREGLADLTDVLASQRTLYQTEDQFIQSEQQLLLTAIALYKAVGGGWEIAERMANGPDTDQSHQKTH